ncbi:MAG: PGF-pre-PGF domain-containing protein [Candidatus Methanospirareceae archaeon]
MKSLVMLMVVIWIGAGALLATAPGWAAGTTELHIVKYANDDSTILNETTVDYVWMMNNLDIYGDGVTHYYHQGPIFQKAWEEIHPNETWNLERDKGNPEEDVNVLTKDLGAVKGTAVKDLCELVGGMAGNDTIEIKAVDGFFKQFPYETIYEPEPRQGPLVVTWYTKNASESSPEEGFVDDGYSSGMRLVFFADTSTNPWKKHVFGINDMRACIPEDYWHYYQYPDYPTTTGLAVKYVNRIFILSALEPPVQDGGTGDSTRGGGGSSAKTTPTPAPSSSATPTPTAVTDASRLVPFLKANEEVAMSFAPLNVSVITLRSAMNVSDVSVTVKHVEKPAMRPPPPGSVYRYLEITIKSAESAQIGGTIEFMVAKAWLDDNDIGEIVLLRYEEAKGWFALPTSRAGEDTTTVYYEADAAEFSLFAITGESKTASTPAHSPTSTATPFATSTATTTVSTSSPDQSQLPEEQGVSVPGFGTSLCGMSMIALFAYRRIQKRRKKR